ncbi:MAG: hypothetical protein WAN30_03645 [Acidimicrobiales bacterium]
MLHLSTSLAHLEDATAWVNDQSSPVVLSVSDADTVIVVAALNDRWRSPIGVWLEVGDGYSASLCARDVKTLSWMVDLEHVVVSASEASEHARIVAAMLTDDEVNIVTPVAAIRGAFNRPAPPRALRVWSFDGATLRSDHEQLRPTTSRESFGDVTSFA